MRDETASTNGYESVSRYHRGRSHGIMEPIGKQTQHRKASFMPSIELNIMQERELGRLIDYERSTCTVDGEFVYRCAFPYRPTDDL